MTHRIVCEMKVIKRRHEVKVHQGALAEWIKKDVAGVPNSAVLTEVDCAGELVTLQFIEETEAAVKGET